MTWQRIAGDAHIPTCVGNIPHSYTFSLAALMLFLRHSYFPFLFFLFPGAVLGVGSRNEVWAFDAGCLLQWFFAIGDIFAPILANFSFILPWLLSAAKLIYYFLDLR